MNGKELVNLIDNMLADAMEWSTAVSNDGYWQGVAYMIASVVEHSQKDE